MQIGFGRTLGICLLIAAIANAFSAESVARAETSSWSAVGDACDCAGRLLGIGWGGGYHTCKSSGEHCVADLPPRSYEAYQRHQAKLRSKACRKQTACSTVYDHFDAGCGDCCDGGCRLSDEHAGCDGGCDQACDSSVEVSPSDGDYLPSRDAGHQHPETAESSLQSSGLTGSKQRSNTEPVFRRFIATATPETQRCNNADLLAQQLELGISAQSSQSHTSRKKRKSGPLLLWSSAWVGEVFAHLLLNGPKI